MTTIPSEFVVEQARVGTLSAGREWFKPWWTIAGVTLADAHLPELQEVTR